MPFHVCHRLVRFCAKPLEDWYNRERTVRQLERVGELGLGVTVKGPIDLGYPQSVHVGEGVTINQRFRAKGSGGLRIGAHTHIGEDVLILTENHRYDGESFLPYDKERVCKEVKIGDCAWICDRVVVLPGVTIGEGAVVGAGAMVGSNIPPLAIVAGSPARLLLKRNEEVYWRLKAQQKFLGWPQPYDLIAGKRIQVRRAARRSYQAVQHGAQTAADSARHGESSGGALETGNPDALENVSQSVPPGSHPFPIGELPDPEIFAWRAAIDGDSLDLERVQEFLRRLRSGEFHPTNRGA